MKLGQAASIEDLEELNRKSGRHFFDPDSKRYFKSIVYPDVWPVLHGWVFLESRKFETIGYKAAREYRVCLISPTGAVSQLLDQRFFKTLETARKLAEKYAAEHPYVDPGCQQSRRSNR